MPTVCAAQCILYASRSDMAEAGAATQLAHPAASASVDVGPRIVVQRRFNCRLADAGAVSARHGHRIACMQAFPQPPVLPAAGQADGEFRDMCPKSIQLHPGCMKGMQLCSGLLA